MERTEHSFSQIEFLTNTSLAQKKFTRNIKAVIKSFKPFLDYKTLIFINVFRYPEKAGNIT